MRRPAPHRYPPPGPADPTLRTQLEGYRSFQEGQAGYRSITFDGARVISRSSSAATVAIQTTSVRDGHPPLRRDGRPGIGSGAVGAPPGSINCTG